MAVAAVAESFFMLCFVVGKGGGEDGLRDVGSFHSSSLCAHWGSVRFWGCFCSSLFVASLFASQSSLAISSS